MTRKPVRRRNTQQNNSVLFWCLVVLMTALVAVFVNLVTG